MEDTIPRKQYDNLKKPSIKLIFNDLEQQVDKGIDIRDEITANNPELKRALSIVEHFLRQTKLPCYGGMAINAHLPTDKKFYDFSKSLPDYDFYSPNAEENASQLVELLKRAKFNDVALRFGVHEGTYKVIVNYHYVADVTLIAPWLFNNLSKNSIVQNGIYYVSADYLRWCMYRELSRPIGEVERWDKVYKRLLLLNIYKPIKSTCDDPTDSISVDEDIYSGLLKYIIKEKFVFVGAEIADIYRKPNAKTVNLLNSRYPLIVFTDEPRTHISNLRQLIYNANQDVSMTIVRWKQLSDLIPEMFGIKVNGKLSIIIHATLYCHSYNTINVPKFGELLISSLDNAIATYFFLSYLKDIDYLVPETVLCFAHRLVEISTNTRDKNKPGRYPLFALQCYGHQKSKETLFAAKAKRIKAWREERRRKRHTRRILEKIKNKQKTIKNHS